MSLNGRRVYGNKPAAIAALSLGLLSCTLSAQQITFQPYIQPGDSSGFGSTDQMVVAWQTDEKTPNPAAYSVIYSTSSDLKRGTTVIPVGRTVDNYLSADPALASLVIPTAYGAHTNYYALLTGLRYDTVYFYSVSGPGLPGSGFSASFHTRTRRDQFSFQVQGDEGYYPGIPNTNPPLVANYEARIIHTMYNVDQLSLPGQPQLSKPDFALNTGDNVYVTGADDNYRDFWFHDWNNNSDSNETGAPFVRSIPFYIVAGNHDVGSTGATVNLLADSGPTTPGVSGPGPFGGGTGGGDALDYFNNYLFPLNGPIGVDIQQEFVGDNSTPSNFFFQYPGFNNGSPYSSPAAVDALRASTNVNTGAGAKRQIDHMSNYSFDYGNAHIVFLDANPHLFDNLLPGDATYQSPPTFPFPSYPSILRDWLIHDLDTSQQTWKFVVYHQPAFSSGNATLRNDQMRTVAKFLEDHGVNMVFNGHEHNYQRTLPLRSLAGVTQAPTDTGSAAVDIDTTFDGSAHTVPDGVIYLVEGAGGNRDFDDALPNPRGSSPNTIDQDDSATGQSVPLNGNTYPNGPESWLDTHLTNTAMTSFLPNAGGGPKITTLFKAKVFSFADITVNGNQLTMRQISEPLTDSSSATGSNPYPYGTDVNGNRLNDPIPDTVFDPATLMVISPPATGTPALLDVFTVTKPDLTNQLTANLGAPARVAAGETFSYGLTISNQSQYALNGTQAVVTLPDGVQYVSASGSATVDGKDVIVTVGRLATGGTQTVEVTVTATGSGDALAHATVRSATAAPVQAGVAVTRIGQ
jgi:uncharacterized repeat protein (TIGR01451 family)